MSVQIRLRRIGKNPKKRPYFRLSVFDKRSGRDSRFIEELGSYNPTTGAANFKKERIEYWLKNGAQVSATIKSLMKKSEKACLSAGREAKNAANTSS